MNFLIMKIEDTENASMRSPDATVPVQPKRLQKEPARKVPRDPPMK